MSVIRQLVCIVLLAVSAPAAAPPNVILITLDTTRADRMGFLGSTLGLTPNLDTLAGESAVFTHAYAQAPITVTSHATILTGTYPQFSQVSDFQVPLAEDLPYAPSILGEHGYQTGAFVGAMVLDPKSKLAPGFGRGFEIYDAGYHMRRPGEERYDSTRRRGSEVVARALAWLDQRGYGQQRASQHPSKQAAKRPVFLWVHLYDAHHPYQPPEPYQTMYARAPYDGGIAYEDYVVGKLLSELKKRGLYDNAVIAVMADHGEGLGDHGENTHGIFLYDETIQVPLVIKLPGADASAGKRIENRVELVDVLPTILQAVGVDVPQEVQGESLLGLMKPMPTAFADRPAYAETDYPRLAFGWSSLRALRTGKYLYIKAPRPELYDQTVDPKELHDLASSATAVTSTLAGQLDTFRQKTATTKDVPRLPAGIDPEAQEKLAALGYVASDPNISKAGGKGPEIDPKDKIEIANMTNEANVLKWEGRCPEAIPVLQQLIAKDPDNSSPYVKLGSCLIAMKDYPQAEKTLREIIASHPDLTTSRMQLAMAFLGSDDIAGGIAQLEIVVEKEPLWDKPHLMLATAYAQTDRTREAVTECEKILELDPNHFEALLLQGQILVLAKQPEAALPRLQRAAEIRPKWPTPHESLAEAYDQLGQKAEAARERAEAKRLGAHELKQ